MSHRTTFSCCNLLLILLRPLLSPNFSFVLFWNPKGTQATETSWLYIRTIKLFLRVVLFCVSRYSASEVVVVVCCLHQGTNTTSGVIPIDLCHFAEFFFTYTVHPCCWSTCASHWHFAWIKAHLIACYLSLIVAACTTRLHILQVTTVKTLYFRQNLSRVKTFDYRM